MTELNKALAKDLQPKGNLAATLQKTAVRCSSSSLCLSAVLRESTDIIFVPLMVKLRQLYLKDASGTTHPWVTASAFTM